MKISRVWAMPNSETFTIKPIKELVERYLADSKVSIDPFARNTTYATYTNDLNPKTNAQYHLKALDFLNLLKEDGVQADLIIFDPPYSLGQVKECYEGVGLKFMQADSQSTWSKEKALCTELLKIGGISIHCGWHSNGMGLKNGFEIIEVLLVAHGRVHNDTIITVERKISNGKINNKTAKEIT